MIGSVVSGGEMMTISYVPSSEPVTIVEIGPTPATIVNITSDTIVVTTPGTRARACDEDV